ncbi:MAG: hypothetical protein SGPRY_003816 [Prymnesium sp.]
MMDVDRIVLDWAAMQSKVATLPNTLELEAQEPPISNKKQNVEQHGPAFTEWCETKDAPSTSAVLLNYPEESETRSATSPPPQRDGRESSEAELQAQPSHIPLVPPSQAAGEAISADAHLPVFSTASGSRPASPVQSLDPLGPLEYLAQAEFSWSKQPGPLSVQPHVHEPGRDPTVLAIACTRDGRVAVLQAKRVVLWERKALRATHRPSHFASQQSEESCWRLAATLVGEPGDEFNHLAVLSGSVPLEPGLDGSQPMLAAAGTLAPTRHAAGGPGVAIFRLDVAQSSTLPQLVPLASMPATPLARKAARRVISDHQISSAAIISTCTLLDTQQTDPGTSRTPTYFMRIALVCRESNNKTSN